MSYRYVNSDKVEKYVAKALEIKGNHHDANTIMETHLSKKLSGISSNYALLDTISQLEKRYNYEAITALLKEHKLIAYLKIASDHF